MLRDVALDTLSAALAQGTVPPKDTEFVSSLVTQGKSRGLSERQWYWVLKFAMRLAGTDTKSVGDFSRVYAMFAQAKTHLKYPKVMLDTASGRHLCVYLSGATSRVPDTVNVVDHDTNTWYGRVTKDGSWEVGHGTPEAQDEVAAFLQSFAKDPEAVAAEYGKLTGNCCFCHRALTDERSTAVGYGKVCSSRYGLSWGKKV